MSDVRPDTTDPGLFSRLPYSWLWPGKSRYLPNGFVGIQPHQPVSEWLRHGGLSAPKRRPNSPRRPPPAFGETNGLALVNGHWGRAGDGAGYQKTFLEILLLTLRCRPSAGVLSWELGQPSALAGVRRPEPGVRGELFCAVDTPWPLPRT